MGMHRVTGAGRRPLRRRPLAHRNADRAGWGYCL